MLIHYHNLIIRDAQQEDCDILAVWWNDGNLMAHAGYPNGLHTNKKQVWEEMKQSSRKRLIIEKNQIPIGEMSYMDIGNQVADIGIKICVVSEQEKGYGKKILTLFINELFHIGFQKIILDTDTSNHRAQHVYETLGFKKIRINPDCFINQAGEKISSIDYELIYDDFHRCL